MPADYFGRRSFLKGSASALALMSLPASGISAPSIQMRLEWQAFKTTPRYASFLNALHLMRATTDATDPNSWAYWVNIYTNFCPHMKPYFLAWNRGYIYYFEQQLRVASGDSLLSLPYWDYYSHPSFPSEFADPAGGNPLYVSGRVNSNVYHALTLAPFASGVINFPRDKPGSFEASVESGLYNAVHDIVGGWMTDVQAPTDPIFYLHCANLDRLWDAWAQQPRTIIPEPGGAYWSGTFNYEAGLAMKRSNTYMPSLLNYQYAHQNVPAAMPPDAQEGRTADVPAQLPPILLRPPVGQFSVTPARMITTNRRSLGGVVNMTLAEESISARVPLQASAASSLQGAPAANASSASAAASNRQTNSATFGNPRIVLDNVAATSVGKGGGYLYHVYLNLPASGDSDVNRQAHFLGTFGPFEVAIASHRDEGSVILPATEVLGNLDVRDMSEVVISLVRVNGPNFPKGTVLTIGEMRIELWTDGGCRIHLG